MREALSTVDSQEKKKAKIMATFQEKTYTDLSQEDKDFLLKEVFEVLGFIKKT